MDKLMIVLQVAIALGILNVWVLRTGKPTPFRPGNARSLKEEFRAYGLPDWARVLTGTAKLSLAALLIVGIWYQQVAVYAAIGLAVLMLGAVAAHVKVRDPFVKSVPALTMLGLCLTIVLGYTF